MMKKIIACIMLVALLSCASPSEEVMKRPVAQYNGSLEREQRAFTAAHCLGLANATATINGQIIAEQCYKNCLGGCPLSGPSFCYYLVQDSQGCIFYMRSRTLGYGYADSVEFNDFGIGEQAIITEPVSVFIKQYATECEGTEKELWCYFLVIGPFAE